MESEVFSSPVRKFISGAGRSKRNQGTRPPTQWFLGESYYPPKTPLKTTAWEATGGRLLSCDASNRKLGWRPGTHAVLYSNLVREINSKKTLLTVGYFVFISTLRLACCNRTPESRHVLLAKTPMVS